MKRYYIGIALGSLLLSAPAFAESENFHSETSVKRDADGGYKSRVTSDLTDNEGTRHVIDTTEKSAKQRDGDRKIAFKTTETMDPKGLMNKQTSKVEVKERVDADGSFTREGYSRSVDAAGTGHTKETKDTREVKGDGVVKETSAERVVRDPKGLGNKSVTETERTTQRNADGTVTTEVEKEVDGKTVEDRSVTR